MVFTLFKLRISEFISGMLTNKKLGGAKGKNSKIALGVLWIVVILMFAGMAGGLCVTLSLAFGGTEFAWLYFAIAAVMACALCFVGSIFAAMSYLYKAKDNELLLSMPIKPGYVLLSRMLVLLAENYGFAFIILIPAGIVWCITQSVTFGGAICYIIGVLVLPLLSLSLSCIFGWLIMLVSSKMRRKKIVTLVLAAAAFGAYMWFCTAWADIMEKMLMNGAAVAVVFEKYMFPFYHFGKAALNGNLLSFALFLLCTVLPFVIVYYVLNANYLRIITSKRGEKKIKYREKTARTGGVRMALLKKELSRYASSSMYILNASAGALVMVIMAVALLIKPDELFAAFELMQLEKDLMPAVAGAALALCAAMVMVSAPSVSVEGKNLWIVKNLPVSSFDVINAKAMCHIVVTIPFVLISGIICAIALKANLLQSVLIVLLPSAVTVFSAYLGVSVNLKFPRFDWISEVHCVKQSASVGITMFGMFGVVAVLAVGYIAVLRPLISVNLCMLLYAVVLLGISFALRNWLKKGGSKIFDAING